jgi:isoquinoline 1-oxidoreductase alpha subunit
MITVKVNGSSRSLKSSPDTPLLYALRNELEVKTPKFGCGLAQCGACSVLLDGQEIRSCITPISEVEGKEVTTVDGLPARWAKQRKAPAGSPAQTLHPVQEAWIEEQVPQCGICQFGMMIKVAELLEANPSPTDDQIKEALTTSGPSPHLCRCASYAAILDGARRAAQLMREKA